MGADDRTKEQLLAELDALRRRVESLEGTAETTSDVEPLPPSSGSQFTKRDVLKMMWAAPIILKVALPNTVFAQVSPDPSPPPFPVPPLPSPAKAPAPAPAKTPPHAPTPG